MIIMDEFNLINKIKQKYYRQSTLIKGVGDDAAVFKQTNQSIVTAVDTFVENIHFIKNKTMSTKDIGYRCLAANISDLAAMGALPKFYLVSVVIPSDWKDSEVLNVFAGLEKIAKQYKMDLIGGDTVTGATFVLSITVIGYVDEKKVRYRSDAKVDDVVFVTGTLGDSAVGLQILLEETETEIENKEYFIRAHQRPKPNILFSQAIKLIDRVCLNDISDGISSELNEIANASKVSIMVEDELIPIRKELKQFTSNQLTKLKYTGGEDFELVGTTSETNWRQIKDIAEKENIQITKIGKVVMEKPDQVYLNNKVLESNGYIHLK